MSPLPSFLTSPPPSVGVEIASDRVTAVSLGRQGQLDTVGALRGRGGCRTGALTPALNAVNIHDEARRRRGAAVGARQARVAPAPRRAGHSRLRREGVAAALREGAGAVGPRSADSLADAEGGAVQAGRGGDLLGAGGADAERRPRVSRHAGASRHHRELQRACATAGVPRGHRRSRRRSI